MDADKKVIARTGEYVHMLGSLIGSSAVRGMRESIQPVETARIWAGQKGFTRPGRVRLDADNRARENVFPGYKEGSDVNLKVGLLRIGDINFATVNGEICIPRAHNTSPACSGGGAPQSRPSPQD